MLDLSKKLSALERIYEIYDRFAATLDLACEKRCDPCCTCNVTMTTLEGCWTIDRLLQAKASDRLNDIASCPSGRRFQPRISINGLAERCAAGGEIPEEELDPNWGSCLFLKDGLCSIYPVRPFGCRCMGSGSRCSGGAADMDPFAVSVNTLILQTIEHVDAGGYFGNLIDILRLFAPGGAREAYRDGRLTVSGRPLIANRPMTKLFVPPEHRDRIRPILQALWAIGEGS